MARFRIQYLAGQGPTGGDDAVEVDAATFKTSGDFTDFHSDAAKNSDGGLDPAGGVVMRVRNDLVVEIRQIG